MLRSVVHRLLALEEQWAAHPGKPRGIPTGIPSLDELTGGLRRSEVTVLAARTSHGKSSLALEIALHAVAHELREAREEGRDPRVVLYVSPEMSAEQLAARLATQMSGVSYLDIEKGVLSQDKRERWRRALMTLERADEILIMEAGRGYDFAEVVNLAHGYHASRGIALLVIDYLQRLSYGVIDDEYRRISMISQGVKDLANELGIPILLVSQLNRQVARDRLSKDERLPDLSDLRGSGRIEEDADNVWLLWRDPKVNNDGSVPQSATLVVAKARSGRVGEVSLWFYASRVLFVDAKSRQHGAEALLEICGASDPEPVASDAPPQDGDLDDLEQWFWGQAGGIVLHQRSPRGRRRGYDFEKRLAKRLGTHRWPGHDGDVEYKGWRIEAKYRRGLVLRERDELKSWLEQVYGYARRWEGDKRWCIALTGGSAYRRGAVYAILPLEWWQELVDASCARSS
jgi:KaiC/GvpD/RAD55 family RecA-like ATPase